MHRCQIYLIRPFVLDSPIFHLFLYELTQLTYFIIFLLLYQCVNLHWHLTLDLESFQWTRLEITQVLANCPTFDCIFLLIVDDSQTEAQSFKDIKELILGKIIIGG
jgi:hypothetical protein